MAISNLPEPPVVNVSAPQFLVQVRQSQHHAQNRNSVIVTIVVPPPSALHQYLPLMPTTKMIARMPHFRLVLVLSTNPMAWHLD
jgi:hypothetical protein